MKNYFKGIAIGILIVITAEYFGLIQFDSAGNNYVSNNQNSIKANYAGIFSLTNSQHNEISFVNETKPTILPVVPLTDQEACIRIAAYQSSAGGKYGAFITKTMIDEMFNGNTNNGIWIFLGKSTTRDGVSETNFIVKSTTEDFTTEHLEGVGYFRLDAICPNYCDGMDVTRCK